MQPRKAYRQVPNFNLIPSEYQKPTVSGRRLGLRLLLFVVIVAEILYIQKFYWEKLNLEAANTSTQQQIQKLEEKVNIVNSATALEQERQGLEQEGQTLKTDWGQLLATQADWPRVLTALFQSQPQDIQLSSVMQDGDRLNIAGTASSYTALVEYRRALLTYPALVQIISMQSSKGESTISFSMGIRLKIGGK